MATIVTGEQYFVLHGKLHEIDRQLRQKGGYPHDPARLSHALQAIVEGRFEAGGDLPQLSTFQSLLDACQQFAIDPEFDEEHFPLEPVVRSEGRWEVCVHYFKRGVSGKQIFARLEAMGYRLCGPRRVMQFIAVHPDLQMDHPLIATVHCRDSSGNWFVPVFHRDGGERRLTMRCLNDTFDSDYRWLVLRRKAAA